MSRMPGQANLITLLVSGIWTMIAVFIFVIGNLVWAFLGYGFATDTNALYEMEQFLPLLNRTYLYILAALALFADIWVIYGQKKNKKNKKR